MRIQVGPSRIHAEIDEPIFGPARIHARVDQPNTGLAQNHARIDPPSHGPAPIHARIDPPSHGRSPASLRINQPDRNPALALVARGQKALSCLLVFNNKSWALGAPASGPSRSRVTMSVPKTRRKRWRCGPRRKAPALGAGGSVKSAATWDWARKSSCKLEFLGRYGHPIFSRPWGSGERRGARSPGPRPRICAASACRPGFSQELPGRRRSGTRPG